LMQVRIFDVEHGGCALVTSDVGTYVLIDCGHNSSTNWRPSTYLSNLGIRHLEQLIITNYDEDHASDLANVARMASVGFLMTNPSVSGYDLKNLKHIGGIGPGIEALANMKNQFGAPGVTTSAPNLGTLKVLPFWNRYPLDFQDENNLSLVVILKAHGLTICFPGDMEVAGWRNLLRNPTFVQAIGEVNVFVASHHGRENGCCEELFSHTRLNPIMVAISDSGIQYATQDTVAWYRQRVQGFVLNGEKRHVLTTRRDGRILIDATSTGTMVYTHVT
jgi:beta-lactamase superfamily II metal-dependent hydrolase